jgi:hypothetical protein
VEIKEIQDAHGLTDEETFPMMEEALQFFKFELLGTVDPNQKAAHTRGASSIGGSGIFEKKKPGES